MPSVKTSRHPAIRASQLVIGCLLVIGAALVSPLPAPVGIFLFAGGMILILRNSRWARLRWVRIKRRWPRTGMAIDRAMRRPSALRRQARAEAQRIADRAIGKSVRVN